MVVCQSACLFKNRRCLKNCTQPSSIRFSGISELVYPPVRSNFIKVLDFVLKLLDVSL